MSSHSEFQSNEYNIRDFQVLSTDFRRTVNYGFETITYISPSLWAKIPSEHKLAASLEEFKEKIKKWKCDKCSCRLCKTFNQILDLLIRNMVSKYVNCSVLLQFFL